MSLKTETIKPGELYHHIFEGYVHPEEIKILIDQFWVGNQVLADKVNIIWDFRNAHSSAFSFETAEIIAAKMDEMKSLIKPGRSAIVLNDLPEKHLVNYLLSLVTAPSKRNNALFLDINSAYEFVGLD